MNKAVMAVALIIATTGCSSTQKGVFSIRPVNQQPDGQAQDALARGDLLFSRGEYALALDAFRRAVRNDPADAHGLNGVAISYAAMGRHDLAREFFELALARAPQDARITRNFARSLTAQGLKGRLTRCWRRRARRRPPCPRPCARHWRNWHPSRLPRTPRKWRAWSWSGSRWAKCGCARWRRWPRRSEASRN